MPRREKKSEGARVTALVVEADAPFDNKVNVGLLPRTIKILVDAGSGPVLVGRELKLRPNEWLVTGTEVPVVIDALVPDQFEVDWDALPSIEDRVAANDPTLTDPLGAQEKVAAALEAAGAKPPSRFGRVNADLFKDALARTAKEPVPDGAVRGVAFIVTVSSTSVTDDEGDKTVKLSGSHHAVLAITVPGREPYALYVSKFKIPSRVFGIVGGALPILVSLKDPTDFAIEWDALGSFGDQLGQRMATSSAGAAASTQGMEQAYQQRIAEVMKAAPGATAPQGATAASGMTPEMKTMMENNAKLALASVTDPAMRQMLIDQYKAAGITVDESGAG